MSADLHEFTAHPAGHRADHGLLPGVSGTPTDVHESTRQIVLDSVVQEIDVKTGLLLFQWDSLDHVPLTDTYEPVVKSAGEPYRLLPHQLDPAAEGRQSADLGPQHVGRVRGRVHDRRGSCGRSAARARASSSGYGRQFAFQHDVRLHTEHRPDRDAVRRRRGPAAGAHRVARDHGPRLTARA